MNNEEPKLLKYARLVFIVPNSKVLILRNKI
jgi:hypothetical protein